MMTIIDPNLSDRIYDLAKQSAELYLHYYPDSTKEQAYVTGYVQAYFPGIATTLDITGDLAQLVDVVEAGEKTMHRLMEVYGEED